MTEFFNNNEIYFNPPAKLIVVDDSHLNRNFIVSAFTAPNYEVISAADGKEGVDLVKKARPEIVLLDIMMPGMDGFSVAQELKKDPVTKDIPIIFITALDALKDKLKAFEAGAVDFVTKPFNHKELIARVRTHVELARLGTQKQEMLKIMLEEKRNSAIARIAAGISHNFNNMLGVSFGNIMLIESMEKGKFEQIAEDALHDVKKSLERMQQMVKQFLVLANRSSELKGGPPASEKLNLREAIEDVFNNIKIQKQNIHDIDKCCSMQIDKTLEIFSDPSHVRELFNLILNEIVESTGGKAQFHISAATFPNRGETDCIIAIKGIPNVKKNAEAIFEPFALPIANVGSGLAFSVAKHLVELNGGKVKADFPGDDELTFTLTFTSA
ncbi:MAG: hypothetical protein A2020_11675 [Lentisphaerae bacterium GWF2_45_14]|nr:MAG: hypothetical protein A2020_11675 [Lentisphaerae bacterium GWF2_45_14]